MIRISLDSAGRSIMGRDRVYNKRLRTTRVKTNPLRTWLLPCSISDELSPGELLASVILPVGLNLSQPCPIDYSAVKRFQTLTFKSIELYIFHAIFHERELSAATRWKINFSLVRYNRARVFRVCEGTNRQIDVNEGIYSAPPRRAAPVVAGET